LSSVRVDDLPAGVVLTCIKQIPLTRVLATCDGRVYVSVVSSGTPEQDIRTIMRCPRCGVILERKGGWSHPVGHRLCGFPYRGEIEDEDIEW